MEIETWRTIVRYVIKYVQTNVCCLGIQLRTPLLSPLSRSQVEVGHHQFQRRFQPLLGTPKFGPNWIELIETVYGRDYLADLVLSLKYNV